jgi:hypothetical protein
MKRIRIARTLEAQVKRDVDKPSATIQAMTPEYRAWLIRQVTKQETRRQDNDGA